LSEHEVTVLAEIRGVSEEKLKKELKLHSRAFPKGIDYYTFCKLSGGGESSSNKALFNSIDTDASGTISFVEYSVHKALAEVQTAEGRVKIMFMMADNNNSQSLDLPELIAAITTLFQRKPYLKDGPEDYNTPAKVATKIFEKVDSNHTGQITLDMLLDVMKKKPESWSSLGLELIFHSKM